MSAPAPFAAARSAVFAVLTVLLGAAAHRAGHGSLPTLTDVVAGFGVSLVAARPLARRQRGLPGLAVGVLGSQLGLHVAFLGHHSAHGPGLLPGRAMTVAHVVAGAALVAWLRSGERALGALARGVTAQLLPGPLRPLPVAAPTAVDPAPAAPRRPRSLVLAPSALRGPPRALVLSSLT